MLEFAIQSPAMLSTAMTSSQPASPFGFRSIVRSGELREADSGARLVRQLHQRLVAHYVAAGDDEAALHAFDRAAASDVELRGITREQLERGIALQVLESDPSASIEGRLRFLLPASFA